MHQQCLLKLLQSVWFLNVTLVEVLVIVCWSHGRHMAQQSLPPFSASILQYTISFWKSLYEYDEYDVTIQCCCNGISPPDTFEVTRLASSRFGRYTPWQAVGKYEEAGDHAIRCFEYYLQHSGSENTDVLTRLGNLQVLLQFLDCTFENEACLACLSPPFFVAVSIYALELDFGKESTPCLYVLACLSCRCLSCAVELFIVVQKMCRKHGVELLVALKRACSGYRKRTFREFL